MGQVPNSREKTKADTNKCKVDRGRNRDCILKVPLPKLKMIGAAWPAQVPALDCHKN
jgi:hypothetical protein